MLRKETSVPGLVSKAVPELREHRWTILPSANVLGAFCPFAQYIEIYEFSSAEIDAAFNGGDKRAAVRVLPLLAHESRHWMDYLSTAWGVRRLVRGFEAMAARIENNPEEFWRIVEYRRLLVADQGAQYYSTVDALNPGQGIDRTWRFRMTCGKRFNRYGKMDENCPIFFSQYRWPDGSNACRIPFSASALLECNAMQFEWAVHDHACNRLDPEDRVVAIGLARDEQLRFLYSPDVATYTTAVHLVANTLKLTEGKTAFQYASALSSIALNLPGEMFNRLRLPPGWGEFEGLANAAIAQRDPGYAFVALGLNAPPPTSEAADEWLEAACNAAGLPSTAEIQASSDAEASALYRDGRFGPLKGRVDRLFEAGRTIRRTLGFVPALGGGEGSAFETPLPPVVANDLRWIIPNTCPTASRDIEAEEWVKVAGVLARQFDEFQNACGI
jgi:hypothetical protein